MKKRKPRLERDVDFIKVKRGRPRQAHEMHSHEANENLGHHLSLEDAEDDKELVSRHVTHGSHLVKGKMDHGMEDYIVAENRKFNGHELGLYAIFDGHSGRDVAEYLQSHLFDNILSEPDFWTNPKKAVKRAYKATNNDILGTVIGPRGGSTAVTAILINQEKLIIANVGDSRAILCRNGQTKQITVDHEPRKEKELVESRGGFVSKAPGNVPRVDGQLAMTRAFGDVEVKEHITSEPDVRVESIDKDSKFLILASDGLWKVMSNEEALDCIRKIDDAQEASEKLIREALSRKSYDDISCVVVISNQEALDCIRMVDDAQEASEKLIIGEALSRKSYGDISCVVVIFHEINLSFSGEFST